MAGLFAFVGQVYDRFYTRNLKYLRGLCYLPCLAAALLCLLLANTAVPGTFNFVGEILLICGLFANPWAASLASTGVFLAAAYSF